MGLAFIMGLAFLVVPIDKMPIGPVLKILLIGFCAVAILSVAVNKLRSKEGSSFSSKIIQKATIFLSGVSQGFYAFRSPRKMFLILTTSMVIWFVEASSIFLMSRVFHLNFSIPQAAVLLVGIAFCVTISAAPGYVGTYGFFSQQ